MWRQPVSKHLVCHFFTCPPTLMHATNRHQFAQLCGQHIHPWTYSLYPHCLFFLRCFSSDVWFHSAQCPHQRSCSSSPQPMGMFDILFFKPHQERGHLKTGASELRDTQRGSLTLNFFPPSLQFVIIFPTQLRCLQFLLTIS